MSTFRTMAEVKRANKAAGQYWFSPDTMAFFSGQVESDLYGGRWFLTSEKGPSMPRAYTVRGVLPDASIETVGEFQQYPTARAGMRAIHALMASEVDA